MPGWVEVKLPSQVGINPYNDTWIIVNETTHYDPATGTPAGLDQIFAAKDFKGDWYKSGSVWEELQYGNPTLFDHNWNIWAGIDGISPVIPDLIIKEPSSLSIGDNVYDPPTLQSGTPFWKIKVMNYNVDWYLMWLQNDGTATMNDHYITAYFVSKPASNTVGRLFYRDKPSGMFPSFFSIPFSMPGTTITPFTFLPTSIGPGIKKGFFVIIITPSYITSYPAIRLRVQSASFFSEDSVLLIP
jgi:hypothetical protein